MNDGVEICGGISIANPKFFLPHRFEAGFIAFTFGTQRINRFKFIRISAKLQMRLAVRGATRSGWYNLLVF